LVTLEHMMLATVLVPLSYYSSASSHASQLRRSRVIAASEPVSAAPDVTDAASDIKEILAGKLRVAKVDHVSDWLPDVPSLPSPFHGGCTVDVQTLETEECVVPSADASVFVDEATAVLADPTVRADGAVDLGGLTAWKAGGPRADVFFEAGEAKAAIVTCGGLCPGLNTVVKELVSCLREQYGVEEVFGVRNGYKGFYETGFEPLTLEDVETIHRDAGSMLGSSRGGHDTAKICDAIEAAGVNLVFTIGGDGTMKGSSKLAEEFIARKSKVVVAHVPKTIDNDVPLIDCSFGFGTSVSKAVEAIHVARDEAVAYPNGVGLVNLMGRHSGFIAAHAAIAARGVDVVLVPEVGFALEGKGGLLEHIEQTVARQGHAVVVVAEGAGQSLLAAVGEVDLSGNTKLAEVGPWLKETIAAHMQAAGRPASLKYVDPTYMVRACPANAADNILCLQLAHDSVHAAFAGYTNVMAGRVNGKSVLIPLAAAVGKRNAIQPSGNFWQQLVFSTGQPNWGEE